MAERGNFDDEFLLRVRHSGEVRRHLEDTEERDRASLLSGDDQRDPGLYHYRPSPEVAARAERILSLAQNIATAANNRSIPYDVTFVYQQQATIARVLGIDQSSAPMEHIFSAWTIFSSRELMQSDVLPDSSVSWITQDHTDQYDYQAVLLGSDGGLYNAGGCKYSGIVKLTNTKSGLYQRLKEGSLFEPLAVDNVCDDHSDPVPRRKFPEGWIGSDNDYHVVGLSEVTPFHHRDKNPLNKGYWGYYRMEQCLAEFVDKYKLDRPA